jgi:Flp pilus assembly secretin CpaC
MKRGWTLLRSATKIILTMAFVIPAVFNAQKAQSADDMLRVYMDQARILKLDRSVSKVIVGNADVADVTVADDRTIVLTGRAYGSTNLVLLDSKGNAILDERILVSIDEGNTVRVYRQTDRTVLSCAPACEAHADTSGSKSSKSNAVAPFSIVATPPASTSTDPVMN